MHAILFMGLVNEYINLLDSGYNTASTLLLNLLATDLVQLYCRVVFHVKHLYCLGNTITLLIVGSRSCVL